jgi:hypothetical protein
MVSHPDGRHEPLDDLLAQAGAAAGLLRAAAQVDRASGAEPRPGQLDQWAAAAARGVGDVVALRPRPRVAVRAVVVGTVLGLSATTAAAATGSLPGPAQDIVAEIGRLAGVSLPQSQSDDSDLRPPVLQVDLDPSTHPTLPPVTLPAAGDVPGGARAPDPAGPSSDRTSSDGRGATPATPATPGDGGGPATPATPATPTTPATPARPDIPATPGEGTGQGSGQGTGQGTPATPATPATPPEGDDPATPATPATPGRGNGRP